MVLDVLFHTLGIQHRGDIEGHEEIVAFPDGSLKETLIQITINPFSQHATFNLLLILKSDLYALNGS